MEATSYHWSINPTTATFYICAYYLIIQVNFWQHCHCYTKYIHRDWDYFKDAYGFLNIRVLKFLHLNEISIFQCMSDNILCRIFKGYTWNSAQNIQPIQWKKLSIHDNDTLRALRVKSLNAFLNIPGGCFKNAYELLTLRALKISMFHKNLSFNVWVRYFVLNFKGTLWNSTQNI